MMATLGVQMSPALKALSIMSREIPKGALDANEFCINCELPGQRCGALIGRSGEYVDYVESVTQTRVRFEGDRYIQLEGDGSGKSFGPRMMSITGKLLPVYVAHMLMMKRYLETTTPGCRMEIIQRDQKFQRQLAHIMKGRHAPADVAWYDLDALRGIKHKAEDAGWLDFDRQRRRRSRRSPAQSPERRRSPSQQRSRSPVLCRRSRSCQSSAERRTDGRGSAAGLSWNDRAAGAINPYASAGREAPTTAGTCRSLYYLTAGVYEGSRGGTGPVHAMYCEPGGEAKIAGVGDRSDGSAGVGPNFGTWTQETPAKDQWRQEEEAKVQWRQDAYYRSEVVTESEQDKTAPPQHAGHQDSPPPQPSISVEVEFGKPRGVLLAWIEGTTGRRPTRIPIRGPRRTNHGVAEADGAKLLQAFREGGLTLARQVQGTLQKQSDGAVGFREKVQRQEDSSDCARRTPAQPSSPGREDDSDFATGLKEIPPAGQEPVVGGWQASAMETACQLIPDFRSDAPASSSWGPDLLDVFGTRSSTTQSKKRAL